MPRAVAAGADSAVLVQADDAAADTAAMCEVARAHQQIAGVVAWVPLDRPDEAAAGLERLAGEPKFAGIRTLIHDRPDPDWLLRPDVGGGSEVLGELPAAGRDAVLGGTARAYYGLAGS